VPRFKLDDKNSIHYQCIGEGENLVLIHGLGANLAFWYMGIARALSRQYRVITYDLRGHGRSTMPVSGYTLPDMANDLEALLDFLGVDHAHIVGHSFGARVALYFTATRPERVSKVIAADTQISCLQQQVRLGDWPYWKTWKKQLNEQGFHSLPRESEYINFQMLAHFNQLSNEFAHGALNRPRKKPSLRHRNMGNRGAERWESLMKTTSAKEDFKDDHQITKEGLQSIHIPTLALFGEYSHCLESCRQLNNYIDSCRVKIMPGAGHFLPAIKPRLFMHTVRQFISQASNDNNQIYILHNHPNFRERRRANLRDSSSAGVHYPLNDRFGELVMFDRRKRSSMYDSSIVSNQ
jgi:pimeloyl-ACP methyl ester carboxylesterase